MGRVREFIGCRAIECADYDGKGNHVYSMWLTDQEIVRCRDCGKASDEMPDGLLDSKPCPDGKLNCEHFSRWDDYNDQPGYWLVEPDGHCAWGIGGNYERYVRDVR